MPSDCKHQSAPDKHGHYEGYITRRVWGGIELNSRAKWVKSTPKSRIPLGPIEDLNIMLKSSGGESGLPPGLTTRIKPMPREANRAKHRFASSTQHPISMGTRRANPGA